MSKGILFIIIASFFFSIINALVKYLTHIPAIEIVFFRSLVSIILCSYSIHKLKLSVVTGHTGLLVGRGLAGALALSLYFYTIQHMPLASAVTILYLAPLFTILISIVLLKEFPAKKQIPFFILCFIGAALIKNIDPNVSLLHFFMGITAAFFAGLAYNFIRMLKGKVHHQVVIFYFPLLTIPLCLPFLYYQWVMPNTVELLLLIGIGICTQLAQIFMTKAYMLEAASKVSQYNYLTCVFAYLTGIIFFNEYLNIYSNIGLLLILIGIYFSSRYAPK